MATLNTANIDFGIVHVGDSVGQAISVSNSAPVSALNDVLRGGFSSASAPFSGAGTLGAGVAAGATDASSLSVGMNTAAAGNYSGTATFAMSSHDDDLADLALSDLSIGLSGTVNNYAESIFSFGSGAGRFSGSGNSFELDYGTQFVGTGALTSTLFAGNGAFGLADLLDGDFSFLDSLDFVQAGFGPFFDLGAGDTDWSATARFRYQQHRELRRYHPSDRFRPQRQWLSWRGRRCHSDDPWPRDRRRWQRSRAGDVLAGNARAVRPGAGGQTPQGWC